MLDNADLYAILQVHPTAHPEVIQAAYRRLALLYHPDANAEPEATELMSRINRAYEVLGDPELRADYDRTRDLSSPSADAPAAAKDATPSPSRRRAGRSALDYITIASSKADVSRVQGPPADTTITDDSFDEASEIWSYGPDGYIAFSTVGREKGQVKEWWNKGGLKVRIVPGVNVTTAELFRIGSAKDDVARLQGTPFRVMPPFRKSRAGIQYEREQKKFWREQAKFNKEFGIEDEDPPEIEDSFDSADEDREIWHYPNGVVEFSVASGRVTAWADDGNSFRVERKSAEPAPGWTGSDFFTLGTTKQAVARVQGKPTSTETWTYRNVEEWHYGQNRVEFELKSGQVQAWYNGDGSLKVRLVPGAGVTADPFLSLGSHKADVVRLQGTPQSIKVDDYFDDVEWRFAGGKVVLSSSTDRVIYWDNREGGLKFRGIRPDSTEGRVRRTSAGRAATSGGCAGLLAMVSLAAISLAIPLGLTWF